MKRFGLLGQKLSHSYSPAIHGMFGDYAYGLFEREECEIGRFIKSTEWDGLNVTIPYKRTVIPFLSSLSETAKSAGSVNTIVRTANGELFGDNTDVYGFSETVRRSKISLNNRKTLVLGSGGASSAVVAALKDMGAYPVVISRSGENNYENISIHSDAEIIINATPVGMYPANGERPVDLKLFPLLKGVFDLIYNPCRTALLLQAEELGIPCENGLFMLVAQAKRSSELFTGKVIPDEETERVYAKLINDMRNIVLIGMPGAGKSTVARKIGEITGRRVLDSDDEITAKTGTSPEEIINMSGEDAFRETESIVLSELGRSSGTVISTGGGCVTIEKNYPSLHQNGIIVWLQRDAAHLSENGRPLSVKYGKEELYRRREPLYEKFADIKVQVGKDAEETAKRVILASDGIE